MSGLTGLKVLLVALMGLMLTLVTAVSLQTSPENAKVYSKLDAAWEAELVIEAWDMQEVENIKEADIVLDSQELDGALLGTAWGPIAWLPCVVIVNEPYATVPANKRIISHEIGHCLGLEHTQEGLMAPGSTIYNEDYLPPAR